MFEIPIEIKETSAMARKCRAIDLSVPLVQNKLFKTVNLSLQDEDNNLIPCHFKPFIFWPNKSIKWIKLYFQLDMKAHSIKKLRVIVQDQDLVSTASQTENNSFLVLQKTGSFTVINAENTFVIDTNNLGILRHHKQRVNELITDPNSINLTTVDNQKYHPQLTSIKCIESNPFEIHILCKGEWRNNKALFGIFFDATYSFFKNSSLYKFKLTIHNSKAIIPHRGKWDLGNENSLFFKSLNVKIADDCHSSFEYRTKLDAKFVSSKNSNFMVYQASSGGENWQSRNHLNHLAEIALPFKGFKLIDGDYEECFADRAEPTLIVKKNNTSCAFQLEKFWQNFPKAVHNENNKIILGLFPQQHKDGFELQPGEKKTHALYIDGLGDTYNIDAHSTPLQITICPHYIETTKTISLFGCLTKNQPIDQIIAEGITSKNNFFAKREVIDEFGWRNFGDIFADHETLEYQGSDELISHYNNQYDPLYGFLIQYLQTNDLRWWVLAEDLLQHIKDIDIYHTQDDRTEYNNGLFWHTDHYLPVETASHRTYSKLQKSNAYMDHAGGGGPGSNHCYTTGLLLHYQLTGDESSKETVEQLTKWITHTFEGNGTFGDMLIALKNHKRKDLKNTITQKYPLDRGTGNYITALIDAFEATTKQSYLDDASLVIKKTISAEDDIASLNLLDIEDNWFYTIFLQATYKYLIIKETNQQFDRSFFYAKQAFIHYCIWMVSFESPYLDNPYRLEYPNHTWAAQDIRKANILYMASYFEADKSLVKQFKNKADELYDYVENTLKNESTRTFTRILTILMQNNGVKEFVEKNQCQMPFLQLQIDKQQQTPLINQLLLNIQSCYSDTSLKKEIKCLRTLSPKMNYVLNKLGYSK